MTREDPIMFKTRYLTVNLMILVCFSQILVNAQTTSVFTTGLLLPSRVITGADNSLLVTEAGMVIPNTGRISIVDLSTGERRTLVAGLPSAVNNLGGEIVPSGPTALLLQGKTLFVTIGTGDAVMNVGPGLEMPNPTPSSPLFDSVMEFTLPGGYAHLQEGFVMSAADQAALDLTGRAVLTNSFGQKMSVRVVANLPDYRANPRPDAPNNVKASNLYGVEMFQKNLYVVDASLNLISRVSVDGRSIGTHIVFPNRPNPLFPMIGGPVIEPVPDSVHRIGNTLLVTLLSGFPFVSGLSEVKAVSLKDGSEVTLIQGLSSAIDVMKAGGEDEFAGEGLSYYTLEFSANQLAGAPGRIRYFQSASGPPVTVAPVLITPTSMARDEISRDIFVTEMFTGRLIRVSDLPY